MERNNIYFTASAHVFDLFFFNHESRTCHDVASIDAQSRGEKELDLVMLQDL